jgi:peptidoglycan/xylan/chitin deacetylase (PgdA/CDA1 family)
MSRRSTKLLKAALTAMHYSGAGGLLAPLTGGIGAIFMLHQVGPETPAPFSPNRILKITPEFLAATLAQLREAGFEFVSMDGVAQRLANPDDIDRPFAAFTLDDAYIDNLEFAAPVFRHYGAPFTVYAPTDYIDGKGELWWIALELAIGAVDRVACTIDGIAVDVPARTVAEKDLAFHTIYWRLRRTDETDARGIVNTLCAEAGVDVSKLCRRLVMDWEKLDAIAADPLATIGGHTVRHFALSKLGTDKALWEMTEGIARLEARLGRKVRHFSYPFGDQDSAAEREFGLARDLGVVTAVTTRKGLVHRRHANSLMALPRLSLNGDFQDTRFTQTLLTGAPFAIYDFARQMLGRH